MSHQLISFKIDANLERMWKLIGVVGQNREREVNNLYNVLIAAYQGFVENVTNQCENLRNELFGAQEEFKKLQKMFDDNKFVLPVKPSLSYTAQIEITRNAINDMNDYYQPRIQAFSSIYDQLTSYFDKLGITDREDFDEIGETDLTESRLSHFKEQLQILKNEFQQRSAIINSYHESLIELEEELEEPLPENVVEIFENELCDNDSVQILSDVQNEYQKLKDDRTSVIDELNQKINYYYDILGVDPSDQMERISSPTVKTIEELESEVQFLVEASDERFPIVVKELNKSISRLCDELYIQLKQRPKCFGNNLEKQANYLKSELEKLKQKQIQMKPILDVIVKLEEQKTILSEAPNVVSRKGGSAKKNVDQDRMKRIAKDQIPKLEEKLYKLLLDYKKENGQDFYFNDIKYIDTINPERFSEEAKTAAAGKKLLFQKMNDSMHTGTPFTKTPNRGKTARLSTYTLSPFK